MMAFVPPFALPFSFSTRDLESSSLYAFGKMSGKIKNADFDAHTSGGQSLRLLPV